MAEINQTGLYLQAVKERRSGVTFHFWVFQLKMIIYIRKQNLEHRIPEATYCIKAELTFVTTSGYYEKWQFVLSIISDFFLASWTFTVKVPISFIWSRFSFHIGKCSQHNEKNKKEMSRRIFFFFSGGGTFITKANVIRQLFPNGKLHKLSDQSSIFKKHDTQASKVRLLSWLNPQERKVLGGERERHTIWDWERRLAQQEHCVPCWAEAGTWTGQVGQPMTLSVKGKSLLTRFTLREKGARP